MKITAKSLIISCLFFMAIFIVSTVQADPPDMPGSHGENGDDIPGGGAPIASGLAIMIGLGGAYAWKKAHDI